MMGVFKRGQDWWIDYYVNGRRKREKIGPNRRLAETVLQKRRVEIAEGKFLDKRKEVKISFEELAYWYQKKYVPGKASARSDLSRLKTLVAHFGERRVGEITPSQVEEFKITRRGLVKPATIHKELSLLGHIFNVSIKEGKSNFNPVQFIRKPKVDNARDRVLDSEEYERLKSVAPPHLRRIIVAAYQTGMRRGEILNLRWRQVDSRRGIIRLLSEETKTKFKRIIPVGQELRRVLSGIPRRIDHDYVFTGPNGEPIKEFKSAWKKALKLAKIHDFKFQDFRHTCITRWRRAGVDLITIMAMSGHRTTSIFRRYNTVDERDLLAAVQKVDTNMDTTASHGRFIEHLSD